MRDQTGLESTRSGFSTDDEYTSCFDFYSQSPIFLNTGIVVKPLSKIAYMKLTMLAKPACNRMVYRSIRKRQIQSIVEIGVGDAARALNMIRVAQTFSGTSRIRYTGVDLFEGRSDGKANVSLIDAHRELNLLKAKTQLVPGLPHLAISRIANSHIRTDLIVISGDQDPQSVERCWFYIPRMLHSNSLVLLQDSGGTSNSFKELSRLEIERLANQQQANVPVAA